MRTRRIVGIAAFALACIPLGILGHGQWKSERLDEWSCADQTTGPNVSFCVTIPQAERSTISREVDAARIGLFARLKGIELQSVATAWSDLWVERPVSPEVRALLTRSLDADLGKIGADFGRQFAAKPKVIVFASAASFEEGLKALFGYDYQTARSLATNNGGALILESKTIAVNWHLLGREEPLTILRHELTHAISREIAGSNAIFPAWFDEGIATREQNTLAGTERTLEDERYVASALVASGRVTLAQLVTPQDWIKQSVALQNRTYPVAATAVGFVREGVGDEGIQRILGLIGRGRTFEAAFAEVAGKPLAAFVAEFRARVAAAAPDPSLVTGKLASGEVQWTIRGLEPNSKAAVTVDGANGYHLTFDVTIDPFGMYSSTFGSTAPPGTYAVRVASAKATLSATVQTGR